LIVNNIKRMCSEKGISLADVEQAVGLGKNTIYKWSTSSPSVSNLKLVADHLGCTVDQLLKEP